MAKEWVKDTKILVLKDLELELTKISKGRKAKIKTIEALTKLWSALKTQN